MTRFTPNQLAILKAMRAGRKTPIDLIAEWHFGERYPAFKRVTPMLLSPVLRDALANLYKVARRPAESFADPTQAHIVTSEAARLLNALFWEEAFPDHFPGADVTKAALRAGVCTFLRDGADGTAWILKELDRSTYLSGALARLATRDVYRVAHAEDVDAEAYFAVAEREITAGTTA